MILTVFSSKEREINKILFYCSLFLRLVKRSAGTKIAVIASLWRDFYTRNGIGRIDQKETKEKEHLFNSAKN